MTQEELLEFFKSDFMAYGNNTQEVLDYITEKTDIKPEKLHMSGISIDYDKKIIKELNGENHEMAKRMLYIIFRTKRFKFGFGLSKNEDELQLLINIGCSFEEILEEVFFKNKYCFNRYNEGYKYTEILYKSFPKEIENLGYGVFNIDLSKYENYRYIIKEDGTDVYEFLLKLFAAAVLLNSDKEKYKEFIEPLCKFFTHAILNEELTVALCSCYKLDDRFFQILKDKILNCLYISNNLYYAYFDYDEKAYLKFLKDNNIETYPYYAMLSAKHMNDDAAVNSIKKLFKNDKDTFYKAYDFLVKEYKVTEESMFLIAIMVNNNESYELYKKNMDIFVEQSKSNKLIYKAYLKSKAFAEKNINNMDSIHKDYYDIKLLSLFYDVDDNVKEYIEFVFSKVKEKGNDKEFASVVDTFLGSRYKWLDSDIKDDINKLLGIISLTDLFKFLCIGVDNYSYSSGVFTQNLISIYTKSNIDEAVKFLDDDCLKNNINGTLVFLEQLYDYCDYKDYDIIFKNINNKSKKIRDFCEKHIIDDESHTRNGLEKLMGSLKGEALKLAKRIIKNWDNERKYGKDFIFKSDDSVIEFVNENIDNDNLKLINWIPENYFEGIRFKDSGEYVPLDIIRYIFSEYMALLEVYRIKSCDKIIERLNIEDFRNVILNVYNFWSDNGSEAKKKNIAIPYCIYSSDGEVLKLKKVLEDLAKASRGAVAAYLVNAIALNGGKTALLMIETIRNKFPNAMVKKAAKKSFSYAAKILEIPEDELCDKIIPDLGFDRYGEKTVDYGSRTFKITLNEDFTLSIFDNEKNKIIKNLPKPGEKDDVEKSTSAKKELSELKKQIKAVIKNQTVRLESVYMNGRTWSMESWTSLFVENPIMHIFANKLIWGVYDNNRKLVKAFRYMEDGTFNTVDEEEYKLPQDGNISLVHPCDLTQDEIERWKEQLKDYEVIQPFEQLESEYTDIEEGDVEDNIITKYSGYSTTSGNLVKMFKDYNMERGQIVDAGGFECYYFKDKFLNIGVQINFEGMYVGIYDFEEEIPLGKVIFYKLEDDNSDEDMYDEIREELILNPKEVPKRFVLSIIAIMDKLIK